MFASTTQNEGQNTSYRIKFIKSLNTEKDKVPNLAYGYDKITGDYFNLNITAFEANVVRRIYQMYINEEFGASKIAKILNEENIKTKRGCKCPQNQAPTTICRFNSKLKSLCIDLNIGYRFAYKNQNLDLAVNPKCAKR